MLHTIGDNTVLFIDILCNTYLKNILGIEKKPLVSSDFNHNSKSSIVDVQLTKVIDDNFGTVFSWYDNEWGFSNRMIDVALTLKNKLK